MKEEYKNRRYQSFNSQHGYPAGKNLFYECTKCGDVIPSMPDDSITCSCGNIRIDIDYGRVAVSDEICMKVFYAE